MFFPRRDLNSQHWYTAGPITYLNVQRPKPLGHIRYLFTCLITGFAPGVTQQVLLVKRELYINLVHMNIHRVFSAARDARSFMADYLGHYNVFHYLS